MKQIEPIQYTTDGDKATQFDLTIINDNGIDCCYINWELYDINGLSVNNGLLFCGDYVDMGGIVINNYTNYKNDPYTFVANNITKQLTIIN
jgi:hypothetical protein